MSGHTPGPWRVAVESHMTNPPRAIGFGILGSEQSYICSIPLDREEDARLIAAAPDLFDAGSRILSLLDREEVEEALARFGFANMRESMREAIAKAKGEQP